MSCEKEPDISSRQLLLEAQSHMRDIEEMLSWFPTTEPSVHRDRMMALQANIEENGETLVIEGFRFESAASKEELMRQTSHA